MREYSGFFEKSPELQHDSVFIFGGLSGFLAKKSKTHPPGLRLQLGSTPGSA
jgi:hypothetical protein